VFMVMVVTVVLGDVVLPLLWIAACVRCAGDGEEVRRVSRVCGGCGTRRVFPLSDGYLLCAREGCNCGGGTFSTVDSGCMF